MSTYYILFGGSLLCLFLTVTKQFSNEKSRTFVYWFLMGSMIFLACCRGTLVGKDTQYYIRIFNRIASVEWRSLLSYSISSGYEIGYVVYNKLLSVISHNGQIVTAANSLILFLLMSKVLRREMQNPILGLYLIISLGIYQSSFNIVSSMIASHIVYAGMDSLEDEKPVKFFACVGIATLFHTGAIFMIVLYFLNKVEFTGKKLVIVLAGGVAVALFFSRLTGVIYRIVPTRYVGYLARSSDNGMILVFHLLIFLVVICVHLISMKRLEQLDEPDVRVHTWAVMVELVLLMIAMRVNIFTRMAYFFMPSLPIFIGKATEKNEMANNRWLMIVALVAVIGLQYILRMQINNIGGSIPYEFFF